MSQQNVLMILERSNSNLEINKSNNEYVLEGVFAQFGVENNNHRIYEEKEYLPHLDYLKKKIAENRLLGELDHPDKFDISLSKVSHLIEDVKYDPKKRQIVGRIKLLDTPSGQIAKNLVDSGVPVSISSRAAGVVKENKKVEIKRIFTYDLVADPGFNEAKLTKVNESFGFSNTDEMIAIYDMGNSTDFPSFLESTSTEEINKETPEKNENKMSKEFVSIEEMNKYSVVLKNEIEKINERLNKINESNSKDEKIASLEEELDNLKKYTNYLAESQNKAIQYSEYLSEKLGQNIQYTEHVAEMADKGISYAEHIAEKADRGIQYAEHIAESAEKSTGYISYLAGKLDESIRYGEYLAGKINETVAYAQYVAEHTDSSIRYSEYLAENATSKEDFQNLTEYTEYMFESIAPKKDAKTQDIAEEKKSKGILSDAITEGENIMSRYSALDDKIEAVLESVKKQKADDKSYISSYPFLAFLSESKRDEFLALNETEKKRVTKALDSKPSFNEEGIVKVWESALTEVEVNEAWLTSMPVEYMSLWENASAEVKDRIKRQSKLYNLNTQYQIKNFWQTRGLGKPNEDGQTAINESANITEKSNPLGYDTDYLTAMAEKLGKSFSR